MEIIDDLWTEVFVTFFVVICLPFYIGYIDSPFEIMLLYALVAGLALAIGERLLYAIYANAGPREFLVNAALRSATVLICGVVPFALAIWLI